MLVVLVGDSKVLATLYGPKEGAKNKEKFEKAGFEVIWKPKKKQSGKFLFQCHSIFYALSLTLTTNHKSIQIVLFIFYKLFFTHFLGLTKLRILWLFIIHV